MTRSFPKPLGTIAILLSGLSLVLGGATAALAQMDSEVESAMASGSVGEQADGYLGFAKAPDGTLKAKVDAINIKRREAYTKVAQTKNVPIEAFAVSIGCNTLGNLKPGRVYSIAKGVWAAKGAAPIALPSQCGN
ncbi:YdbL family protein [Sphingomonas abietis]|uniref:YdbL family protein n=1 Tax=Sphingomonas abietis TaxID=3012344 RepID=A0ABY7NN33_9SPHN|nr:YdbL family protein [Sphingomonas abietis]WBO20916.1 YdbL family protein [Sphingomonas abietis]